MSFITNLRADRLIAEIKATDQTGQTDNAKALEKLAKLGPSAIPRIIDALASAGKQETAGFVSVLSALLDYRTFPSIAAGLVAWTGQAWPDLAVAAIIATLFLHSAYEILRSARTELRELSTVPGQ